MKNLKIYKKAVMMMIVGTTTLTSTGCINKVKDPIQEVKSNNEMDINKETNLLEEIDEETFIADGISQKPKRKQEIYYLIKQAKLKRNPFPQSITVKKVEPYQRVTVLENYDSWKLIKWGKSTGYIKSKKIKKMKEKCIEVDISKQKLKLYSKKGKVILKTKVVTGIPTDQNRMTVLGLYEIYNKQRNRTLVGKDYETLVKYWMPFYKNYGIHDAYWRSEFGGEIYKSNGSHGCVNLPKEVAPKVYQKVSVGTPVVVHE